MALRVSRIFDDKKGETSALERFISYVLPDEALDGDYYVALKNGDGK